MKVMSSILRKTNNDVKVYLSKRMVHSKLLCIDRSSLFFGSANFNSQGMKKVSELNVLIENDKEIIKKWLDARIEHLKECSLIMDYRELSYNKVFSFLESIYC
jgi:cardiolipin synthase